MCKRSEIEWYSDNLTDLEIWKNRLWYNRERASKRSKKSASLNEPDGDTAGSRGSRFLAQPVISSSPFVSPYPDFCTLSVSRFHTLLVEKRLQKSEHWSEVGGWKESNSCQADADFGETETRTVPSVSIPSSAMPSPLHLEGKRDFRNGMGISTKN